MTGQGNGKPIAFRIVISGQVSSVIQQEFKRASVAGQGAAFRHVLEAIGHRLQAEPEVFGEPKYHLHHLQLQIRLGIILPVVVEYGLHQQQHIVFLRRILFLPAQHG